jgi:hypothetical protein
VVIAAPPRADQPASPQSDPPIDAPPWVYPPEAKGAIPISDANADLLKALSGLNQGANLERGQVPDDVLRYMATHPAYAEGQTIPNLTPAVRDLFSQERAAAAQQGEPREAELNRQLWGMRDYPNLPPLNDMANEQNSWRVSATVPGAAPPATAGPQSFAATVPPQSVSSFNQAVQQLGLTPQEQNLYQHHLSNLWGGGRVVQPGGDVSTVLQAVVQGPDGRYYNIPTVWNGQALDVPTAERQARLAGMSNYPSYATPEEADARYMAMHGMMERDTAAWLAQNPNADPMTAMLQRQQQTQHPVLQMLEQLRQQQGQ